VVGLLHNQPNDIRSLDNQNGYVKHAIDINNLLKKATVPEHSVHFMQAMSGGEPFLIGSYLFLSADNLLLAVGYPVTGNYDSKEFDQALTEATRQKKPRNFIAIAPSLPERLQPYRQEQDQYYILPLSSPKPARLERLTQRTAAHLHVEKGRDFTLSHKRLWAEFVGRQPLTPVVRRLYENTEKLFPGNPNLILLNAWTKEGKLTASLLLDLAPKDFLSYIIGAHSRIHYVPYASDLLFSEMIQIARQDGKDYLHLGLAVNSGIRRFKTKWGGIPFLPYEMATWKEEKPLSGSEKFSWFMSYPSGKYMTNQSHLASLPIEKPFTLLWEIEKNGSRSWIGGTAHFFNCSFESTFRKLFNNVHSVIFEGPLDQVSMQQVTEAGQNPGPSTPSLIEALTEKEIRQLERIITGPQGPWHKLLGLARPNTTDVRYYLSKTRPWFAFFSLWAEFLKNKGWNQSVDMEAWHLAREMNKIVFGMETIAEQIETLEDIPLQRIINFFRACSKWDAYTRQYEQNYLQGNLDQMLGSSAEFPSRTELVIKRRDEIFMQRMLPYLNQGRCAVFVGAAHMLNLRQFIAEAGFNIRQVDKNPGFN
jgi:uncharacterized protein YbaP (TraB family)